MRGPKLLLLVAAVVACACDRPASAFESPPSDPPGIERIRASPTAELPPPCPDAAETAALDAMPWGIERILIEQARAAADPRFAPRVDETGPVLETPGSVVATFTQSGTHLSFGGHETTLRVAAIGRDEAMRELEAGSAHEVVGAEIRTRLADGVVEWWRSLPSGLEHGVTIAERPVGNGELTVEVAVSGDLSPRLVSDDAIELRDAAGASAATYAHLVVLDAAGARVPARMSVDGERIALAIDDAAARYPLVIDPLVTAEEATLIAPDGQTNDLFGCSVALSSDGSRAIVGACYDDILGGIMDAGSARVFVRTGTTWTQETTLVAPDGATSDLFGWSVALSSDGSRALVGAPGDYDTTFASDPGSVRVFARTGTTWAQEATLLEPDGGARDQFGSSVALSSDGSRALVGAWLDDTADGVDAGSARVFVRTGTTWTQETTLLAPDGAAADRFGSSVALSSDGSRAVVGAYYDDTAGGTNAGSAHVFLRTGTTWAQEATLLASDGAADDNLGAAVALSLDGSRALVGAPYTAGGLDAGSAHVYARTGTTWAQEATLLAPDGASGDSFGSSVALSSDGSRALVGAWLDDTARGVDLGSARVFVRTSTTWTQETTLVVPDGGFGGFGDHFGCSVALSSDGSRALVGESGDDTVGGSRTGSAHVFTLLGTNGSPCGGDAACISGFCTDGVCCGTSCGGGTSDCQACSAALTGAADGTCAPLSPAVAPTVVCRASTDACDGAEVCSSTSTSCPADAFLSATTVCRAAGRACDRAETCTGSGAACPADLQAVGGTVCRAGSGAPCNLDEVCDGIAFECPSDRLRSAGTECRPSAGPCDVADLCNGTSPACPADAVRPSGTPCAGPVTGPCDALDVCDGVTPVCAEIFRPAGAPCGSTTSDVCDAPDECTGASGECLPSFLSGVECRVSSGGCDPAEVCGGASASCPPDAMLPAGVSCRASTDTTCDPEEMCDGVATNCPADVTTCAPRPDAGAPLDAPAITADAGTQPVAAAGCGCRAGGRSAQVVPLLGLLLTLAVRRRRLPRR